MKKASLILFALCLCLLTACGAQKMAYGKVVEVRMEDGVGVTAFVVRDSAGKDMGFFLTDEARVYSFAEEVDAEEFLSGEITDIQVTVFYGGMRQSLVTEEGDKVTAYTAEEVQFTGYLKEETVTLSDGTTLGIWQESRGSLYTLPDGTELLRQKEPFGPDIVYGGGKEGFYDLSEAAKAKVLQFYQEQGFLYDIREMLETVYARYCNHAEDTWLGPFHISQDTSPTASNDRLMYFMTSLMVPWETGNENEVQRCAAFDRKTGEAIPIWDLFTCSPEEAKKTILDIADIKDPALQREMELAFGPDSMVFYDNVLEVSFPLGTLPGQEVIHMLMLDYDERLTAILQEWAIPQARQEAA